MFWTLFYIVSPIWSLRQIKDTQRSWFQMQKVYIHSYFTQVEFWALGKHILKNIDDFGILIPLGDNFESIWDILSLIWPLPTNQGELVILVANAKGLYPFILHFGGFLEIEEAFLDSKKSLYIVKSIGRSVCRSVCPPPQLPK